MSESQTPDASQTNAVSKRANSRAITSGLLALAAFGYLGYTYFIGSSVPIFEVPPAINKLVSIEKCEVLGASLDCVMRYKGNSGQVAKRSLAATFYDKDGVKLGVWPFPDQIVLPNEAIKTTVIFHHPIKEIAKVLVGVR